MQHEALCRCGHCQQLDRKHPLEGHQLAMFDAREQRPPTEGEALAALFQMAGKATAYDRGGQRSMML